MTDSYEQPDSEGDGDRGDPSIFKRESIGEYEESTVCSECGSNKLSVDHERAELICEKCGLVVNDEFIDTGPEWRAFDSSERDNKSRVGAPMTFTIHDKGLSTMIDWRNRDFQGGSISSSKRAKLYRMRKWQKRVRVSNAMERNLAFALSELDRMCSQLKLPQSVREDSAVLYRQAIKKNLIRGRSIEGVAASVIYASCRQRDVPRTLDEIAEVARVPRKEIGRTFRFISRELGFKLLPISPKDYIPRFCSELELSESVEKVAHELINEATQKGLVSGRGPTGVAASAIYISALKCGEKRTQREVAEIASVTEVTIRNRYKELAEELNIDIPL
ncbi:transcription initiation factor IIB [Methanonatronarchaeum sp. AMET6-2]|nr:transcription initiation factor IIB [Methanonatronarchaeum sp. AMET6-2]UOY10491.1 transcription initiation factor IIB [Methanonatronarchaeum sp. AMET6-2]